MRRAGPASKCLRLDAAGELRNHCGRILLRRLGLTLFIVATLITGALLGGRASSAPRRAQAGAIVTAKSTWSALRANLRAAAHDETDSRRAVMEDDDVDDGDEEVDAALTSPSPPPNEDDTRDPNDGAKASDEPLGDPMGRRRSGETVRAARGFGNGTERPPRLG